MTRINNLKTGNLGAAARQQRRDLYGTPLNGSSIGYGGMRYWGTGRLTVENEGLFVNGVADVTGVLNGSGTNNFSGVNNLSGENHLTGPTDVAGDLELIAGGLFTAGATEIRPDGSAKFGLFDIAANGDLSSKGKLAIEDTTTLSADLNVESGGKVKVGTMTLDPGVSGGALTFGNGSQVFTDAGSIQVFLGNSVVQIEDARAKLQTGGAVLETTGAGVRAFGGFSVANAPQTSEPPNVFMDSTGLLYRSTA